MLTPSELERYDRQIWLEEIGKTGQEKLKQATVCVCGVGGLGSPAAVYLAAAGIGTLILIDNDRVALSNLNRQILHGESDINRFKVDSGKERLMRLNSGIIIRTHAADITSNNVQCLVAGSDVIIDALDTIHTRMILNRAAINLRIPLVHGAVNGFEGRALTIIPGRSACLGCLYRKSTNDSTRFPVIGAVPAVIGAVQSIEAIKILIGIGDLLKNRMIVYDGLKLSWTEFKLKINPGCDHCGHLQQKED